MTRSEIVTMVLSRLGRQETNAYLVAAAKLELALIQTRLEGGAFMPWFLLSGEITTLSTTANQRFVTIPADFLREYEDFALYRYDSSASADPYIRLAKDEFDVLEEWYGSNDSGPPEKYAVVGQQLQMFPTPAAAYPLRWQYFAKGAVLDDSSNTSNVWTINAPDLLVGELGLVMARYKRDTEAKKDFTEDIIRANVRLMAFDEARKQAMRDAQMGGRDT